jgi:hypothetical protein
MNRKKLLLVPMIIIVLFLVANKASAQSEIPVEATISIGDADFQVGDPVPITLSVVHPDDYQVIFPQLDANWGEFIVQGQSPASTSTNGDGTSTTTQVVDARLFAPGEYDTPPVAITVTDGTGELAEVIAQSAVVTISSVLVEGDTELRDIKPQAELPYLNLLPWIVAAVVFAVIFGLILFAWRKRRARLALAAVDTRLPHEIALDELARINGLGLPKDGRFKEHYTLVSDCIRLYMERTYEIPVLERTTSEIQVNLKSKNIFTEVSRHFVSILDVSDLVKFSKFQPDIASAGHLIDDARQLVIETKPIVVEASSNGTASTTSDTSIVSTSDASQASLEGFSTNGAYQQSEVGA